MFETMYANKGIGLAAQQVGRAMQLTVLDVRGATDRPSTLEIDGKETDVAALMPLVLINPEVEPMGDPRPARKVASVFLKSTGRSNGPARRKSGP